MQKHDYFELKFFLLIKLMICFCTAVQGQIVETKITQSVDRFGARFGSAVVFNDTSMFVASPFIGGSVHIFDKIGVAWVERDSLLANDPQTFLRFGISLALRGERLLIGATGDNNNRGAVYVFEWNSNVNKWFQVDKFVASDGRSSDFFGSDVALLDDMAIVTAPLNDDNGDLAGSAYVFKKQGGNWTEVDLLIPADAAQESVFARSMAVEGNIAVFGAPGDAEKGYSAGAAYVYKYSNGVWTETQKLFSQDIGEVHSFGHAVAVQNGLVTITAPGADGYTGATYIFADSSGSLVEKHKLSPNNVSGFAYFGESVALRGNRLLIGTSEVNSDSGAAYLFAANSDGSWSEQATLTASDGRRNVEYAKHVYLNEDEAFVSSGLQLPNGWLYVYSNLAVGIFESADPLSETFDLLPNYPNPFNPSTTIAYTLRSQGKVRLSVFDLSGREISRLVDTVQQPGHHTASWNTASLPTPVSSGVYFVRLEQKFTTQTRKIVLIR